MRAGVPSGSYRCSLRNSRAWRIVAESDRVEMAALTYAGGDLSRLHDAVALALVDWRQLLAQVGDV
jgi:hypothetical protein